MSDTPDIPGAEKVVEWFGYWPMFHDAEVLSIKLDRSGGSNVSIHAFERSSEVDSRGYYVLRKHAIVTFAMGGFLLDEQGITNTRIDFFNHQNVLADAWIETTPKGHTLRLDGIFGVDASITCEHLSVSVSAADSDGSKRHSSIEKNA